MFNSKEPNNLKPYGFQIDIFVNGLYISYCRNISDRKNNKIKKLPQYF